MNKLARFGRRVLARIGVRAAPLPDGGGMRGGDGARFPVEDFRRLRELQSRGPVHAAPAPNAWLVLGYDEVAAVLADPALFSSSPQRPIDTVLLGADPPHHAPVRRALAPFFSADYLTPLLAGAEEVATHLIRPEFDAVGGYAIPLTAWFGARFLGVDEAGFGRIVRAAQALHHRLPLPEPIDLDTELRRTSLYGMLGPEGGGPLGEAEAASIVSLFSTAATETAERLIARCVLVLLQRPGLRLELRDRAGLLPTYVEEVLRLFPSSPTLLREAARDTAIGGTAIPGGAQLRLSLAAANRDPAHFGDPDALRLDRPKKQHFSFGGGPHQCIGAGLGRRIATVALATLLREAPGFEAAEPLDEVDYQNLAGRLLPRRLLVRSRAS